ncbi:hypothetical protein Rsub_09294 [Raphidocelis subcapitata]|uniref:Uncharacterized protein n=1 Tax=Raphidocelis subcapitata TaxID=307507 RepID=A0A2V0P9Z1_9CHLO|nr:hypothetical protein Rsub_09294 [Raphidocelis subcapitata]|eukprot:GBF96661.1 hypothetical protein Rsub_09294 [Raphidocelis subcapitata]
MRGAVRRLAARAADAAAAVAAAPAAAAELLAPAAARPAAARCPLQRPPRQLAGPGRGLSSYASPGAGPPGGSAPRRVSQPRKHPGDGGGAGPDSASASASASAAGPLPAGAAAPGLAEMSREVPGGSKPMRSWERWYWGVGVGGASLWLFWRMRPDPKTPEQIEAERRAAADLEVRRRDHLRSVLAAQREGGFIAEGDDPLDGLSPRQIEALMAAAAIDPRDPLEGMSPEEIDEYMRRMEQQEGGSGGGDGGGGGEEGSSEGDD